MLLLLFCSFSFLLSINCYLFQSEGNVDNCLYATKPDRKMELTRRGIQQAYVSEYR